MPRTHSRNTVEHEGAIGLHVFNRGKDGAAVFRRDADRDQFVALLGRYLRGPLGDGVSLLAFCLLTTHFHLVIGERAAGGAARLMHRLVAAYSIYYRNEYGGSGPLFAGPYRRVAITDLKQLRWTIGYVNDNHPSGVGYRYSSHRFIESGDAPSWLAVNESLNAFGGVERYLEFIAKRIRRKAFDHEFF